MGEGFMKWFSRVQQSFLTFAALALAVTCTSEKIVYRSGTNFAPPPAAAANFIGYYDDANKQTVCGSCHVDFQTRWAGHTHASAWSDLQGRGGAAGGGGGGFKGQ